MPAYPALSDTDGWTLLRTKGEFTDDADYAGTNALPPVIRSFGRHAPSRDSATLLSFACVAVNSSGVAVNRGSDTFNFQLVEVFRPVYNDTTAVTHYVNDSASIVGTTYNRIMTVDVKSSGIFGVRLHTFSGTPAGGASIRIFVKMH